MHDHNTVILAKSFFLRSSKAATQPDYKLHVSKSRACNGRAAAAGQLLPAGV